MKKFEAKAVLCDIEGTTTSISFVKEVLFPYSKEHAREFLSNNRTDDEVISIFKELQTSTEYTGANFETLDEFSIEEISKFAISLIENDVKFGPLKRLQGLIWKIGFENGSIKGHIYPDVASAFKTWTDNSIKIYIYSSGSVQAQRLLFQNSVDGNLLPYISGYFDTQIGNKQNSTSYSNILKEINLPADQVLFFTDIVKEAEAAKSTGIKAVLLERPGNAELTEDDQKTFTVIKSFDEISIQNL